MEASMEVSAHRGVASRVVAPVSRSWRRLRRRPRAVQVRTALMIVAIVVALVAWLVLACVTGVALVLDDVVPDEATSAAPALPDPPGVPVGARTSQATSPTTMAMKMSAVRTCVARGRRRMRRQDRPNGARGWKPAPLCAGTSMLASIFTLLHGGLHRRPPRSGRRP